MITAGHLRLNSLHCLKPGHAVCPGDVLTFAHGGRIRVIRILALGQRRSPAMVAQTLHLDLDGTPSDLESSAPLL